MKRMLSVNLSMPLILALVLISCDRDKKLTGPTELSPAGKVASQSSNTPATGVPTIHGTSAVGFHPFVSTSGIADADGMDNATFSYQWISHNGTTDTEIQGATRETYTIQSSDLGKYLKVRVSFTDDAGNVETLTSAEVGPIQHERMPPANVSVTPGNGQLSVSWETPVNQGTGFSIESYHVRWFGPGVGWPGEASGTLTGLSYTITGLTNGDETRVQVWVNYSDQWSVAADMVTVTPTGTVTAKPNTPATGAPTISGTAQVGQTLTASTSDIVDADGLSNATFSYQWLASRDTEISGATSSTYTLVEADEDKIIKVRVNFTDDAGNEETLTSTPTGKVAARPETSAPNSLAKVSGDGQEGPATTQLDEPLVVSVLDDDGTAIAGVDVTFAVTAGGGMLSATTNANPCIFMSSKSSITAITDANGQAATRLTLGSEPGTNTVEVTVEGLEPVTFTATAAEQAAPHSLTKVCGEDQEGTAGEQLVEPLVVSVLDEDGAAIVGVDVSFAVTAGGGTLSSATATTNANGRARTWLTLGSELGTNTVEATVEGLESVTFTATGQESPLAGFLDAFLGGSGKPVVLPDSSQ